MLVEQIKRQEQSYVNIIMLMKKQKQNMKKYFDNYVDDKTIVINVSVDVDSLLLMKQSKLHKALYIDSSIEDYEEDLKKQKPIVLGSLSKLKFPYQQTIYEPVYQ